MRETNPGLTTPSQPDTLPRCMACRVCVALWLITAAFAQAATPLFVDAKAADNFKVYWLVRAAQPPVIDGQLDDAIWQETVPLTDWGTTNYGRPIKPGIVPGEIDMRAAWDDTYLYMAARCYHRVNPDDMKELVRNASDRSKDIYGRECIEIHIDGNLDHATRFQAIVNPLAEKMMLWHYDFGWGILTNPDYGLDADWDVAAAINEDHWTVEVRFALSDIQVEPRIGNMFGINPCWFDWADSKDADGKTYWWQYVTWSTHGDSHHDPRLYGRFILVDKAPATLEAGLKLAYPDLQKRTLLIQTAEGLLAFRDGKAQLLTYEAQVMQELSAAQASMDKLHALLEEGASPNIGHLTRTVIPDHEKTLATLTERLAATPIAEPLTGLRRELATVANQLDTVYWQVKQDALLSALPAVQATP